MRTSWNPLQHGKNSLKQWLYTWKKQKDFSLRKSYFLGAYLWYAVMLLLPMLMVLAISFSTVTLGIPPYTSLFSWCKGNILSICLSFENYLTVFSDALYLKAYLNSIQTAFIATVICLVLGYPIAYGIAQARRPILWLLLAVLPFWTSFLVRVYAWISFLGPEGVLNHWLQCIGFEKVSIMHTPYSVTIAMVYTYLPFMIFPLYSAIEKMDPYYLEASYDLGCRPSSAFWRITFPLSMPGILTGVGLVFVPMVGEYIIPELLGGPESITIGRVLWIEFFVNRDWPMAATLAIVMIVLLLPPVIFLERLSSARSSS